MSVAFAAREIKHIFVCWAHRIVELWNGWDPQPTRTEVARLTAIEMVLCFAFIVAFEAIF